MSATKIAGWPPAVRRNAICEPSGETAGRPATTSSNSGVAAPLDNVEMIKAPKAGAVLFDVKPGDRVKAGDRLASIVYAPGEPDGSVDVIAPQSGYVVTRRSTRILRAGDDVLKLIGDQPSTTAKGPGSLEA